MISSQGDRRIAKQDTDLLLTTQWRIHRTNGAEGFFRLRCVTARLGLRRVQPDLPEGLVRNVLAAHEPVGNILISRISTLDDDVVDDRREPRIANQ